MQGESFIAVERDGFKYILDTNPHDCISREIQWSGIWERTTTEFFKKNMKKGDVVIDIGANIGYFTMLCSRLVGESGKVIAFEPFPAFWCRLQVHIALNQLKNVECIQAALFNRSGLSEIRRGYPSAVLFQEQYHKKVSEADREKTPERYAVVTLMTLDSWFADNELKRIDYIKLDVDGPEGAVLEGAAEVIDQFSPVLVVEVVKGNVMLMKKLQEFGYVDIKQIPQSNNIIARRL